MIAFSVPSKHISALKKAAAEQGVSLLIVPLDICDSDAASTFFVAASEPELSGACKDAEVANAHRTLARSGSYTFASAIGGGAVGVVATWTYLAFS